MKDLTSIERLFQAGDGSFPPLRSLDAVRNNLPVQRTRLVGRDDDVAEVCALVAEHRLVTLTGIGGAGKTRLAIAAAAELVDRFPDGVFVAELASIASDDLVVQVVAEAADLVGKGAAGSMPEHVARVLAERRVLVVLDNCEQVIDGAAEFVDLFLDAGDKGRLLATSRESLGVDGERTVGVRSLGDDDAVTLLAERATDLRPGFSVTTGSRATLANICEQLDGIPLAIELAAAQLAHLSVQELSERLDERFELLSGGRRRRRQRQQTLSAMMDWSWELLNDAEQRVLAAFSVFAGGWTLPAAEYLCAELTTASIVGLHGDLLAKSLLVVDDTPLGSRYRLLETVRLYGERRLVEAGRAAQMRDRHAAYWVKIAEREGFVGHVNNLTLVDLVFRDLDNARSAVDWLVGRDRVDEAAQIVSMLSLMIKHRNHNADSFTTRLLARDMTDRSRAQVLVAAAFSAWISGNFPKAAELGSEAEELAVAVDDPAIASVACIFQSFPWQLSDPDKALQITARGERHAAAAGVGCLQRDARAYTSLVWAFGKNEPERAERTCQEDLPHTVEHGNDRWDVQGVLGSALEVQGKWSAARDIMREQHRLHQAAGFDITWTDQIEMAALNAELGDDNPASYQLAHETAKAEGVIGPRPEFLLQPLGRAIRSQDWSLASELVDAVRDLSRQGVAFISSNTIAIYLYHRRQVAQPAPEDRNRPAADYHQLVNAELDRLALRAR